MLLRLLQDQTQTDLINLRRTIYLTIMSSAQFEEAGHKLMKIKLAQGQEIEVVTMLIECCSQEKTYIRYCITKTASSHLSNLACCIALPGRTLHPNRQHFAFCSFAV